MRSDLPSARQGREPTEHVAVSKPSQSGTVLDQDQVLLRRTQLMVRQPCYRDAADAWGGWASDDRRDSRRPRRDAAAHPDRAERPAVEVAGGRLARPDGHAAYRLLLRRRRGGGGLGAGDAADRARRALGRAAL